jgi:hypothetical protein
MLSNKEMKSVIWKVEYCASPTVLRYCKKCGKRREYICSGEFRINAQQKALDIWLIYKCVHCNTTWNSTIFSHVSPQQLGTNILERFHSNDETLAMQYAMNIPLLQRNGVEIKMPAYQVIGENISLEEAVNIKIQSQYFLPLKISSILRTKLGISQREFYRLLLDNRVHSNTQQDLKKCKLSSEIIIAISQ